MQQLSESGQHQPASRSGTQIIFQLFGIVILAGTFFVGIFASKFFIRESLQRDVDKMPLIGTASSSLVTTTRTGILYQDIVIGSGVEVSAGKQVTLHYSTWRDDGRKFDSSWDRNNPFTYMVARGFESVDQPLYIVGMRAGGIRKIFIPPGHEFSGDVPGIGPYGIIYLIELIDVEDNQAKLNINGIGDILLAPDIDHPQVSGTAMGYELAPVRIDVFSNFLCEPCKNYSQYIEPKVIQYYISVGDVYYVFHHVPFPEQIPGAEESYQAANASMCAAEQELFWEYHDLLFTNLGEPNTQHFTDTVLIAFAEVLGLDMEKFTSCFEANTYKQQIEDDINLLKSKSVYSIPSIFVNGEIVSLDHVPSEDDIIEIVQEALEK